MKPDLIQILEAALAAAKSQAPSSAPRPKDARDMEGGDDAEDYTEDPSAEGEPMCDKCDGKGCMKCLDDKEKEKLLLVIMQPEKK